MKKLLLFRSLALLALLTCVASANAEDVYFSSNGIYYRLTTYSDGSGVITVQNNGSFNTYSGEVHIPDSVFYSGKYYPVTGIGYQAFKDCTGLTVVTIPEGVEMLLNEAFAGCTSLEHITLPSTLTSIYNNAFTGCTNLVWIQCLRETAKSCSANNFDASTYANVKLYVPQGSLSSYQNTAPWSQFSTIQEDNKFVVDGIYYTRINSNTAAVTYRDYDYNSYWGNVIIPPTVTYGGVTYLVTEIGTSAFNKCKKFYGLSIKVPNTVTKIGNYAFSNSDIYWIELGNSVNSIGAYALDGCDQLSFLVSHADSPPIVQSNTFPSDLSEIQLWFPGRSAAAYRAAPYWSNWSEENCYACYDFEIGDLAYEITNTYYTNTVELCVRARNLVNSSYYPSLVYYNHAHHVTVPDAVTYDGTTYDVTGLGFGAFANCDSLETIDLPDGLKYIGAYAFYNCLQLNNVTIPDGVETIGNQAFIYCEKFTDIVIPNSVKTIGDAAFYYLHDLKHVTIGSGLEYAGYDAFYDYFNEVLESVTCYAPVPPAGYIDTDDPDNMFENHQYNTATLYVPSSSLEAYKVANSWRKFKNIETFVTLDDALNVPGGTLHFESNGDYPWQTVTEGDRTYAQSSNAGVKNSESVLTTTMTLANKTTLSFDFMAWGEGTSTVWDACVFAIDGEEQFRYGALQNDWETYTVEIPAGTHTLTWSYTKDGSVDADGDYFAVDNVSLGKRGDVNNDGSVDISDATTLINFLLSGNATGINMSAADVDNSGGVDISDATTLINYLLNGNWP